MTGISAHVPTELERIGDQVIAPADELSGSFTVKLNLNSVSDVERNEILANLAFGRVFSDHMAHMRWTADDGWHNREVIPFAPISLSPAASVLHYAQSVFEGIKAYRHEDGSIWTFRPGYNAARLNHSARRMAMPEMAREDFIASIVDYVRTDKEWVPATPGSSLYLRPFMFASEAFLGVHPARTIDYYLIGSPSGPYFSGGFNPVSIWVTTKYHRAGPGGTGTAKTGGNYAASLLPQIEAEKNGFQQVCYLDTYEGKYIEELGGMNFFVVMADGSVRTPSLTGVILEGGTRSAICRLLRDRGTQVREEQININELVADISSGKVAEIFACGTAAVVTPIGRLASDDFDVTISEGPVTKKLYDDLTDIQMGKIPDPYGWTYQLA